jgi:capsular exopolysaccharide synthesis family protein
MAEAQSQAEAGVDLRHYLDVVRRRKWIFLSVLVVVLAAAGVFTVVAQPTYEARTTIVVGEGGGIVQPQNANAIQPFSATMEELLTSSIVASRVIDALRLNMTSEQLLNKVGVSFNPESAALQVSVIDTSRARAKAIAAEIGVVFSRIVTERLGSATGPTAKTALTAVVWDPAHLLPGRVTPKRTRDLAVAGVLGILLGLVAVFVREHFDRRLRSAEEIEGAFGVPVIGQIAAVVTDARRPRVLADENGQFAEAFRGLRANLQYLAVGKTMRTILVTSASAGQGKTTVCANLSIALAGAGANVALLEADLRRPQLGNVFGLPRQADGLTNVLVGRSSLSEAVHVVSPSDPSKATALHSVSLLSSGPLPPNPSELLGSSAMREVVHRLGTRYDFVIVDSPPILLVSDAVELAQLVDGVIVVVRSDEATREEARDLRNLVERLDINLVGVVVTGVRARTGYGAYYAAERELQVAPAAAEPAAAGAEVETIANVSAARRGG